MLRRVVRSSRATCRAVKTVCSKTAAISSFRAIPQVITNQSRVGVFACNIPTSGVRYFSTSQSRPIRLGDKVVIHIEGRLTNGEIFDPRGDEPQEFIVGDGEIIPGLEQGLLGMVKGQIKTVEIPPEFGFGPAGDESSLLRIPKADLELLPSEEEELEIGAYIGMENDGDVAKIVDIDMDSILVDTSHELAGETLHLTVEIVDHVNLEDLDVSERLVVPYTISPGDEENFPEPGDTLAVHYDGYLTDGTLFDSSRKRGKPFEFVIGSGLVIKGWDEALLHMSKGEKARLFVPAAKGYGAMGAPPVIPPNSDLLFDVELIQVKRSH